MLIPPWLPPFEEARRLAMLLWAYYGPTEVD